MFNSLNVTISMNVYVVKTYLPLMYDIRVKKVNSLSLPLVCNQLYPGPAQKGWGLGMRLQWNTRGMCPPPSNCPNTFQIYHAFWILIPMQTSIYLSQYWKASTPMPVKRSAHTIYYCFTATKHL